MYVHAHVYSPDIPVSSADCTMYTPGIGTRSFTVSSPLWRIQHLHNSAAAIAQHYNLAFFVPLGTCHCWVVEAVLLEKFSDIYTHSKQ